MTDEVVQPFPPLKKSCELIKLLGEKIIWTHGNLVYDAVRYRGIIYVDKSTQRPK